jgi:hypothetical protein
MERKIWIGLTVIIGIILSTLSAPVFGAQPAINSNNPILYRRTIPSQWTGGIMAYDFGFDPSGEIITWEIKKTGMEIVTNLKNELQWSDISYNIDNFPSDTVLGRLFQPQDTAWTDNWTAEKIFSNNAFFSSKESQTEEEDDTSDLPQLPNALWICGFGIMGILSVRRTNDQ